MKAFHNRDKYKRFSIVSHEFAKRGAGHVNVTIRRMTEADIDAAFACVKSAFDEFVAPGYSDEGIREFYAYASPAGIASRFADDVLLVAVDENGVVAGMLEARDMDHISLLFVRPEYQRMGVAKALVNQFLRMTEAPVITVHASPYAVPVYERLGFARLGGETLTNGIRYTPMVRSCSARQI